MTIAFSILRSENPIIISIDGRLDAISANSFETSIHDYLSQKNDNLIFDLEKLAYISSAGIRVFLLLINKLEASKKKIGIINPDEMVKEIIEISGLKDYMPIFEDIENAIASFKRV
ncbi:MAG: STAS domain-containing protein [Bacteroidales bacterium]|jgi:anti-sigma B factor antagonist|nr:STAS domain-containing protein [Bacteroidales bacterium]MDD2687155.1 STAS domain-containing protein [Bacteroidales bacterium]MDD3330059.1 STAS domain-containing protein [Bacteroidales bacterium]MDD3691702.1 STAS domain-containing protein [Bacteroidales bacterium]MDD4044093.1 STAS domain-containing protein [Bacteroidales bacterium]